MVVLQLDWFTSLRLPATDWIQVEASSYCNAFCVYCPHTIYRDAWLERHMSLDTFRKMLPAFTKTRMVFLQGWGEPFLNPDFISMVTLAKESGCLVGTATNGSLLDEKIINELVKCGLDILSFSLAGTYRENDTVRKGTNFKKILNTIRVLNRKKQELRTAKPAIHIAYMLLRSRIDELEGLPMILKDLGINQIVVSTLDFVPSRELEDEALIPKTSLEYNKLRLRLEAFKTMGRQYDLSIYYYLYSPGSRRLSCTENVQRALFISAYGEVSPCVFLNIPVSGVSHRIFGEERSYQRLIFGNINEQPLETIWRNKNYAAFRKSFYKNRLHVSCEDCPKLFMC